MFGFWEILIILGIVIYALYNYAQKKEKKIAQQKNKKIKDDEDIIDLDEDSYEILDD